MNKAEKRFVRSAALAVFLLLAVLLGVINGILFTMAARDADAVTEMISRGKGTFVRENKKKTPEMPPDMQFGQMGPNSPEVRSSVRYFTVNVGPGEIAQVVALNVNAIDETTAENWAIALYASKAKTGWTHGTYRYRVWKQDGSTYVTVIDQGRELLTAYRILLFSVCGTVIGVIVAYLVLRLVGRRIFAPIEEADRKQKTFISGAEQEFKVPLTVISAETELLERAHGPSDQTASIARQVRRMNGIVRRLGSLAIFDESAMTRERFSLSEVLEEELDRARPRFEEKGLALETNVTPGVFLTGSAETLRQVAGELIENALKYSRTKAAFSLSREEERIRLTASHDTELPAGSADQVFDRFTTLSNAAPGSAGLGLAYVKDAVKAHNGRVSARSEGGEFVVGIDL